MWKKDSHRSKNVSVTLKTLRSFFRTVKFESFHCKNIPIYSQRLKSDRQFTSFLFQCLYFLWRFAIFNSLFNDFLKTLFFPIRKNLNLKFYNFSCFFAQKRNLKEKTECFSSTWKRFLSVYIWRNYVIFPPELISFVFTRYNSFLFFLYDSVLSAINKYFLRDILHTCTRNFLVFRTLFFSKFKLLVNEFFLSLLFFRFYFFQSRVASSKLLS